MGNPFVFFPLTLSPPNVIFILRLTRTKALYSNHCPHDGWVWSWISAGKGGPQVAPRDSRSIDL